MGPTNDCLVDRTNTLRLATTDPNTMTIYLSNVLHGDFLKRVLTHELGHACMISYNLLPAIHRFVSPGRRVEAEEWICNFIADYGTEVLNISNMLLTSLIN